MYTSSWGPDIHKAICLAIKGGRLHAVGRLLELLHAKNRQHHRALWPWVLEVQWDICHFRSVRITSLPYRSNPDPTQRLCRDITFITAGGTTKNGSAVRALTDGRTDRQTDRRTLPILLSPCFAKATRTIKILIRQFACHVSQSFSHFVANTYTQLLPNIVIRCLRS